MCALVCLPACGGGDIQEAVDESGETSESGEGEAGPTSGEEGGEAGEAGEVSTGDGDATSGDGDGDASTGDGDATTTGDGDGDATTAGDGDGDATSGDGDGDTATGDGDGDATAGDGVGDSAGEGPTDACTQFLTLDFDADEANLSGDWDLVMSSVSPAEGLVIFPGGQGDGEARFDFDAPCEDNWYVWVRGLDAGTNDSFFLRVDGAPNEPGIFDLDCGFEDNEPFYRWAPLNIRGNSGCGLDSPMVLTGGPSTFEIEFTEREGGAISGFSVSNDPSYVP